MKDTYIDLYRLTSFPLSQISHSASANNYGRPTYRVQKFNFVKLYYYSYLENAYLTVCTYKLNLRFSITCNSN